MTDAPTLPVVETFHSLQGEGLHAGRSAFFIRLAGCSVGCPWCDTKPSWDLQAHPRRSLADLASEMAAAASAGAAFAVVTGGEPLEHDLDPLCAALAAVTPQLPLHLETSGAAPLKPSGRFDWITLSPKRHRPPGPELLAACDELKVVVHEPADLAFAEAMAAQALAARAARMAAPRGDAARANDHPPVEAGRVPDSAEAAARAVLSAASVGHDRVEEGLPQAAGCGFDPAVSPAQAIRSGPALLLQPGWNCRRGQELALAYVRAHPAWRLSLQSHKWLGVR